MPNTADGAESLLGVLTDEELARYGQIARDQATYELRNWGGQVALGVSALAVVAWAATSLIECGCVYVGETGRSLAWAFAVALALGYWPYRRVKNWSLWQRHVKAVNAEQSRRHGGDLDALGAGTGAAV